MRLPSLIPAAQYLRTSTDRQPESIEVQERANVDYAVRNGFSIVRTYIDAGRRGLLLERRPGLCSLLHDIAYGNNDYQAVLVYDVSRWGRFQDGDEAAHYEFFCKALHVPVHYCAESFKNDHCLQSFILKSLKRTMAGEYSRELSAKCFRAQKNLAELGFRVGGIPGYGLRRLAVSDDGSHSQLLRPGELKSVVSDHVMLVPGPPQEVRAVRTIFTLAEKGRGFSAIARELNRRKVPFLPDRIWQDFTVKRILTNDKYTGWNVWNRCSKRLSTPEVRNPVEQWVKVPDAFAAIVTRSTFERVQKLLPVQRRYTDEELIARVTEVSQRAQGISKGTLRNNVPSINTLRRRLKGLSCLRSHRGTAACRQVLNVRQHMLLLRNRVLDALKERFPDKITEFHLPRKSRLLLRLDNGLIVSVVVCPICSCKMGLVRWMFRRGSAERSYPALVCLDGKDPRYYIIPRIDTRRTYFRVGIDHELFRAGIRLKDLSEFYRMAESLITTNMLQARTQ